MELTHKIVSRILICALFAVSCSDVEVQSIRKGVSGNSILSDAVQAQANAEQNGDKETAKAIQDAINLAMEEMARKNDENAKTILAAALDIANKKAAEEKAAREAADAALEKKIDDETAARLAGEAAIRGMISGLENKLSLLADHIEEVENMATDGNNTLVVLVAALRDDYNRQKDDTSAAISSLNAGLVAQAAELDQLQTKLTDTATSLQTEFNTKIAESAASLREVLDATQAEVAIIGGRVDGLTTAVSQLQAGMTAMNEQMAAVQAQLTNHDKRIAALELYNRLQKFCAAAAISTTGLTSKVVQLQSANATLFGAATSAQYGYGNLMAKLHRYKKAEEFFDRFHYHNLMLNIARQQLLTITGSCATLLAMPARPEAGGAPVYVGRAMSVGGSTGIAWKFIDEREVKRLFRFILSSDQASKTANLDKILASYNNIFEPGAELSPEEWDRHVLGAADVVANGLTLSNAFISNLEMNFISATIRDQRLPTAERTNLCEFGGAGTATDFAVESEETLRYASLEDGMLNGANAKWHLPQKYVYFHDQLAKRLYISKYEYTLAAGPALEEASRKFNDAASVAAMSTSTQLLDSISDYLSFATSSLVNERNVSAKLDLKWKDADQVCGNASFTRGLIGPASFQVRARIAFEKSNGCWIDRMGDTNVVCSQIRFNPAGTTPGDLFQAKHTSFNVQALSSSPSINLDVQKLKSDLYPNAVMPSANQDMVYVVEPFAEVAAGAPRPVAADVCHDRAAVPDEYFTSTVSSWGTGLSADFSDTFSSISGGALYRLASGSKNYIFNVRGCYLCATYGYSGTVSVKLSGSNTATNYTGQKLMANGTTLFGVGMPTQADQRCVLNNSLCSDYCRLLSSTQLYLGKSFAGSMAYWGEANNPIQSSETYDKSSVISSGRPFTYDYRTMINRDKCTCTENSL